MATVLTPGDIAIVGYTSDDPDSFIFVVLRDIDTGTTINFTDNGWQLSGGFRSDEGTVSYTAATAIVAGTAVTLTGLDLDDVGDQIIAYQGAAATPSLLYAIDFADGDQVFAADSTSKSTSAIPTGLFSGVTAVATAADIAAYTGPVTGLPATWLALIGNPANWTGSDFIRDIPGSIFGAGKPEVDLDADNSTQGGNHYRTEYGHLGPAVAIADIDIRIADSDSPFLESATITIQQHQAGDLLTVNGTPPGGITTAGYDAGTGTLTLFGQALLAEYELAIRQVEFSSTSAFPGEQKRVEVTIFDGNKVSGDAKAFIAIVPVTFPPSLDLDENDSSASGLDYTATFTQGGPATPIADVDVVISDDGSMLASATITLGINRQPDDLLSINGPLPTEIEASDYDPDTGVLTLAGSATLAQYETALLQVVFSNSSATPFAGERIIEVTVTDGVNVSEIARTYIHVVENAAPQLNLDGDESTIGGVDYLTTFTMGGPAVAMADSDVLIVDADNSTLVSATFRLTNPQVDDSLSADAGDLAALGIIASAYDAGSGTLILTGDVSLANYQDALQLVKFNAGAASPSDTRIIEIAVNDGTSSSNIANAIVEIFEEAAVNPPVVDLDSDDSTAPGGNYRATFTEDGAAVAIADDDTTITDDGSTLASATITLINPEVGDALTISGTLPGGIDFDDSVAGMLTLTNEASLDDYETALEQIRFSSAGDDPVAGSRIIEVVVNDGTTDSNATQAVIDVTALNDLPSLGGTTPATYVENAGAVVLAPLASLIDPDDTELNFVSVEITAGSFAGDGDVLAVNGATSGITVDGITFQWDPTLKSLVFNGTASIAAYEALLQQVDFHSTSDNPTDFGANPARNLLWSVVDAQTPRSAPATVEIVERNDAPALTVAATAAYTENAAPIAVSPAAALIDVDSTNLTAGQITIISGGLPGDVLSVNGLLNGTFAGIGFFYLEASHSLFLRGAAPVADYQAFFQAVKFHSTSDNPTNSGASPTRTLAWAAIDGVNVSAVDITMLSVSPANDAPVNAVPAPHFTDEDVGLAIAGVAIADIDSSTFTTKLTVLSGILTVADGGGAAVTGNGTASVTISGTAAEINTALAGLAYLGNPDFSGNDTLTIVTSDGTLADSDTVVIVVNPMNDPPVISGGGTVAMAVSENATSITTIAATEPDGTQPVYAITGGADAALFLIDPTTGSVAFLTPADFEAPADADRNNIYEVIVSALDDAGGTAEQLLSVTVANVDGRTIKGTTGHDKINLEQTVTGQKRATGEEDRIKGLDGNDGLSGGGGNDVLIGTQGDDRLSGNAGDDRLIGGLDVNNLKGGAGHDIFVFNKGLSEGLGTGSANPLGLSEIRDFTLGEDLIELAKSVFVSLAHVDYRPGAGALIFDPNLKIDGDEFKFATLAKHLALTDADFILA